MSASSLTARTREQGPGNNDTDVPRGATSERFLSLSGNNNAYVSEPWTSALFLAHTWRVSHLLRSRHLEAFSDQA